MTSRSLKLINHELRIVDERIHSKKMLLKKFPNDRGLKLSLMTFEDRKGDLIRELADLKNKHNIVTFDISLCNLNNGLVKLSAFGDISNRFQDLVISFLMTVSGPVKKGIIPPTGIINESQMRVEDVQIGSLKITLSAAEDNAHIIDSPLKNALIKLNDLIDCKDDKDLIIQKMEKYGSKPIFSYKQFLGAISKHDLNLKLYENSKPEDFKVKEISNDFAKSVYKVITESQETITEQFTTKGTIFVVNTESYRFGIKTEQGKYSVSFNKDFKDEVKTKLDCDVKVKLEKIVEPHEVEGEDFTKYKLLSFNV